MRISDWSSDVCSSDLAKRRAQRFVLSIQTDALLVAALHFLQEQQVGAQSVQAQTQVRQRFTTARCRTAFVNVVAYDPDNGHGPSFVAPATLLRYCAGGYAAHAIASRRRSMAPASAGTAHADRKSTRLNSS